MDHKQERILCAAISYDGMVLSGYRHKHCYAILTKFTGKTVDDVPEHDRGFLTSHNRFVGRAEGYQIARTADQLILKHTDGCNEELISENLYWPPEELT